MASLEYLNLSYNNLDGEHLYTGWTVPRAGQLQEKRT